MVGSILGRLLTAARSIEHARHAIHHCLSVAGQKQEEMMGADPSALEFLLKKYQGYHATFSGTGRKLTGVPVPNSVGMVLEVVPVLRLVCFTQTMWSLRKLQPRRQLSLLRWTCQNLRHPSRSGPRTAADSWQNSIPTAQWGTFAGRSYSGSHMSSCWKPTLISETTDSRLICPLQPHPQCKPRWPYCVRAHGWGATQASHCG